MKEGNPAQERAYTMCTRLVKWKGKSIKKDT